MRRTATVAVLGAALAVSLGACGESEPLALPPRPSTVPSTAPPVATGGVGSQPATSQPPTGASTPQQPGSAAPAVTGAAWVPATGNLEGLASECGNMSFVSARPDRDMLIAGIAQRGLWASSDGGATWEAMGGGAGGDQIVNRTSAIVYDPADPNVFWESGTYNAGGVYRTDDNGVTFRQLGDATHSDLVAVDFSDPERRTLLSGTHELPQLLRSTDGGETWSNISGGLPEDSGFAISPHIVDADTYVLGTRSGPAAGVFRTTDGGATWSTVFEGGVSSPPLVASDGALYWALEAGGGLIKSVDQGLTFTRVPARIAASPSLLELPDGRFAAMTGERLAISDDRGATWTPTGPEFPFSPVVGFTYSAAQQAFFIWHFDCDFTSDNPVPPDAIMRLDFAAAPS